MVKYILEGRGALGTCYLRKMPERQEHLLSERFTRDITAATRFDDIGPAKEYHRSQEATITGSVWRSFHIVPVNS